jgi:hypothetical protein
MQEQQVKSWTTVMTKKVDKDSWSQVIEDLRKHFKK